MDFMFLSIQQETSCKVQGMAINNEKPRATIGDFACWRIKIMLDPLYPYLSSHVTLF